MSIPTPSAGRWPAPRLVSLAIASVLASAAPLALADSAPAAAPLASGAPAQPDGADRATRLDGVEVTGERIEKAASPKYTEALLDTPQTITVVDKATMDQQGLVTLREILTTLPGITFGAGEGGGGYGDSINLRGFSANADLTVDGVRDSAQYSRTDNFNLESLELVNGANSVHSGAGSVGGNINLVSKVAMLEDFSAFTAGAGTENQNLDTRRQMAGQNCLNLRQVHGPDERDLITVSLGVSCMRPDSPHASPTQLIAVADEALHLARQRGRNRVIAFGTGLSALHGIALALITGQLPSTRGASPSSQPSCVLPFRPEWPI